MHPASASSSNMGDDYVSSFTAPAMPNLPKAGGFSPRKPGALNPRRAPRTPLAPHKLAKLANALGVSTPLPAASPSPGGKRSFPGRSSSDDRSTTVGGESRSSTPATGVHSSNPHSRYLIHVVPPPHFPHESQGDPDSYASFRRGSLVPLHQTLQAQLGAIQREFLLPTAQGLILYLVGDTHGSSMQDDDDRLGRGPRISDDIWKWISSRVADEQQQQLVRGVGLGLSGATSSPAPSDRGMRLRTLSTSSRVDNNPRTNFTTAYPLTPSPSSPSTTSVSSKRKESPSRQPTSSSRSETSSISPDTPPTSSLDIDPSLLPGLHSPSLIPVLTKVEFDIDRRNGGAWYDTWSRSRKGTLGRQRGDVDDKGKIKLKITISSNRDTPFKFDVPVLPAEKDEEEAEEAVEDEGYARLSESPEQFDAEELTAREPTQLDDKAEDTSHSRTLSVDDPPQHTPAMPLTPDPLADVFGSDDQAWSDLQTSRPSSFEASRIRNGELALDGITMASLPPPEELAEHDSVDDDAEVVAIWNENDQPALDVPPPTPPRSDERLSLKFSPSGGKQRPVPPPLTLPISNVLMGVTAATPTASPFVSGLDVDDSKLPFLNDSTDNFESSPFQDESMSNESVQVGPVRTDEKRGGGIYEDLDLDLEISGYADTDGGEIEADQIKLSNDLDALEQKYHLLSPKELSPMPLPDEVAHGRSPSLPKPFTAYLSPVTPVTPGHATFMLPDRGRLVPTIQQLQPARKSMEMEEDVSASPPTFRQPLLVGTPSPRADSFNGYASGSSAGNSGMPVWPAVPFATTKGVIEDEPISPKTLPLSFRSAKGSPPRLMLNGKARESPKGPRTYSISSGLAFQNSMSSESAARVRQHEEEYMSLSARPGAGPLQVRSPDQQAGISPVMPLSPDPFGRFPSSSSSFTQSDNVQFNTIPPSPANGSSHADGFEPFVRPPSKTPSSRFSSDSVVDDSKEQTKAEKSKDRATLMSVKSIKKLWRRTNKPSTSGSSSNSAVSAIVNAAANAPLPMQPRQSGEISSRPQTPYYDPRAPVHSSKAEAGQRVPVVPQTHRSNGSQSSVALLSHQKESPSKTAKSSQRDSGLDPFYFDQEKYPARRSPTPSSASQRSRTPSLSASISLSALPPSPNLQLAQLQAAPAPAPAPAPAAVPTTTEEKKLKSRKSFLRWKSGGGSSGENKEKDRQSVDSTSTSSSAHEQMSKPQKRSSRRPSLGDLRFSSTSSAHDFASPSVPQIPPEYRQSVGRGSIAMGQRQSVQQHRASESTDSSDGHLQRPVRTSSLRRKPVPSTSMESNMTVASSEQIHTPTIGSISNGNPLIEEEDERNYEFISSTMHQKSGSLVFQPEIPVSAFQYE